VVDPRSDKLEADIRSAEIIIGSSGDLTPERIAEATNLKFLQLIDADETPLDLASLEERGVLVAGIGESIADPSAAHVLGLMIATARLLGHPDQPGGSSYPELSGKILGVIGFGNVGQALIHHLDGQGCELRFADVRTPAQSLETELRRQRRTVDRVLIEADFVVLLPPLTPQTLGFFGAREFNLMKPEAILVNAAHPRVIVPSELLEALDAGKLAGVGITYRDDNLESHENVVAISYPDPFQGDVTERSVGLIADNLAAAVSDGEFTSILEPITVPVVGDPTAWSSRLTPKRRISA
jgi:phosphoglycerate dehydrogenase-like enzyme